MKDINELVKFIFMKKSEISIARLFLIWVLISSWIVLYRLDAILTYLN